MTGQEVGKVVCGKCGSPVGDLVAIAGRIVYRWTDCRYSPAGMDEWKTLNQDLLDVKTRRLKRRVFPVREVVIAGGDETKPEGDGWKIGPVVTDACQVDGADKALAVCKNHGLRGEVSGDRFDAAIGRWRDTGQRSRIPV